MNFKLRRTCIISKDALVCQKDAPDVFQKDLCHSNVRLAKRQIDRTRNPIGLTSCLVGLMILYLSKDCCHSMVGINIHDHHQYALKFKSCFTTTIGHLNPYHVDTVAATG